MGSFMSLCSSESSTAHLGEENRPLRNHDSLNRTPDGSQTSTGDEGEIDPIMSRNRKARADWIRVNNNGQAPDPWIVVAVWEQYDDIEIVEIVFDDGDRALHKAVKASNIELAHTLLSECAANIDSPSVETGDTPLTLAAAVGDTRMVQLLLNKLDEYPINHPASQLYQNNAKKTAKDIASESTNKALWALLAPEKLAELVVNNPHALSPPPPGEATVTTDDEYANTFGSSSISSSRPESPPAPSDVEGDAGMSSPPGWGHTQPPMFDDTKDIPKATTPSRSEGSAGAGSEFATTPSRPAAPRRSNSVNVINGIPEDVATPTEWKGGFILKRKPDWLGSWQQRYLLVKGEYIGWASEEVNVDDPNHPLERKKFNSYEHLNKVDRVEAVESSSNCKFKVLVSNATKSNAPREYEFKTETPGERDEWVALIRRAVKRVRKASRSPRRSPRT